MSDTGPPTYPGNIDVNPGQTARGPSPYANLSFPSKIGGEEAETVGEDPGGQPTGLSDEAIACADPELRKRWNADAVAQASIQRMLDAAYTRFREDLQNREFGALICQFSDGSVGLSEIFHGRPTLDENGNAISYGPDTRPTVPIEPTACGSGIPLGYVHSHPGNSTGIPSQPDFLFGAGLQQHGANPATLGVYVVASYPNAVGGYAYHAARSALSDATASQAIGYEPAFVNPQATQCPGS